MIIITTVIKQRETVSLFLRVKRWCNFFLFIQYFALKTNTLETNYIPITLSCAGL